jgi:hypothetical protein
MKADWTYQYQQDKTKYNKEPTPKFNIGDTVLYEEELVTIKNVRKTSKSTFTYDIEEYPFLFVFEFELTVIKEGIKIDL